MSVAASEDHISYFSRDAVVVVVIRVSFPARAMISFEEGQPKKRQFREEISPKFSHTTCVRERERVCLAKRKRTLCLFIYFLCCGGFHPFYRIIIIRSSEVGVVESIGSLIDVVDRFNGGKLDTGY